MLEMLRDLVAHKGYANAALLTAVRQHPAAAAEPELRELLHHILLANRFWLLTVLGVPFDHAHEARLAPSFDFARDAVDFAGDDLVSRYRETHTAESAWLEAATAVDLERILENPLIPGGHCSVWQALVQVCLHSHGHRAQAAKVLRRIGGVPPATDFILWLAERPGPAWD